MNFHDADAITFIVLQRYSKRIETGPDFAVKEFRDKRDFDDEFNALKLFHRKDFSHKHLIEVLGAFSYHGKDFLIFPLANGNLNTFWEHPGRTWSVEWMLEQCTGLTEGLEAIHNCTAAFEPSDHGLALRGRHGDIKPQNILWFHDFATTQGLQRADDLGRLVISDFSLMRFHIKGSNTETTANRIGWSHTYRAPEKDAAPEDPVDQKYDVWSLGCVFLNFISCYLAGYDATLGKFFTGDTGQAYQSFATARQMEEPDKVDIVPRDNYFHLCGPKMKKAKVKHSVTNVSKHSISQSPAVTGMTKQLFSGSGT